MKKRRLIGDELKMAIAGLKNKNEERNWLEYQLQYYDLMLKTGLEMNHKKNIRDFKQNRNEFEQQLEMVKATTKILNDQIRNGIEIKEKIKTEVERRKKE